MSNQPSLLDALAATAAREEAVTRVEAHAAGAWKVDALAAVERVARQQRRFTSDDVWRTGLARARENRALGAVFRRAAALGLIEATDEFTTSEQVLRHRAPIRVWRSLTYEGP